MSQPYFSILLPTRNRSEIVGDAIRSALAQTYVDFELVISDNDESPDATRKVVEQFDDPRIRYYRTGDLSMFDNWEYVFAEAKGRYVFILEDKVRLVPNALELIQRELVEDPDAVVTFRVQFTPAEVLLALENVPRARVLPSETVIDLFRCFSLKFFDILPKGLDSCAPRALLQRVKERSPTGMLYSHLSPDYASGFMTLAAVSRVHYLDAGLAYIPNNWMWKGRYSTGQSTYRKGEAVRNYVRQLPFEYHEVMDRVPVKAQFLWINGVLYDYFTKYRDARGNCPPVDWVAYHSFCMFLVLMGVKLGGDMRTEVEEIEKSLAKNSPWFLVRVLAHFTGRCLSIGWGLVKKKAGL